MKPYIVWLMFVLIIIYNLLDSWQTYLLLEVGLIEANPILNYLMIKFNSFIPVIVVKAIPIAILGIGLTLKSSRVNASLCQD